MKPTQDEMFFGMACGGGKSSVLRAYLKAHPEAILLKRPENPVANFSNNNDWVKRLFEEKQS